jgi:hypothetical protein
VLTGLLVLLIIVAEAMFMLKVAIAGGMAAVETSPA